MKFSICTLFFLLLFIFLSFNSKAQTPDSDSAVHDFDFYIGEWEVQNNRQTDDGSWEKFKARVSVRKALNGKGNVDFFESTVAGKPYHGMTVRTFDARNNEWHIRWIDTDNPTDLPVPSKGRFENGEGKFYKVITAPSGREVTVRFLWTDIEENSFHWQAGWSSDGEQWNPVWTMDFTRID